MVYPTEVHLYRRLLRAVTYLPDSYARIIVHDEIVERFRRHRPKSGPEHLTIYRVKKARQFAGCLERAGYGNLDDLKKVLMHAHGRAGFRRRQLIRDLIRPDENLLPKDDSALKELIESPKAQEALKR
jgi:Complex 1 protein (LYR family)